MGLKGTENHERYDEGEQMKKALAYVAAAVMLGFAVMIMPLTLGPQTQLLEPGRTMGIESPSKNDNTYGLYGLGRQPLSLLPSSLVFFSGLIAALSVYIVLKRRTA